MRLDSCGAQVQRIVISNLLFLMVAATGCDRTPVVTVYISADESVAQPVIDRFEAETGIKVHAKFDTEASKTTGMANILRAERARPRADIFWSSEQMANVQLAAEGVTTVAVVEDAAAQTGNDASDALQATSLTSLIHTWPLQWRDTNGVWFAFAGRARVIAYVPGRVPNPPQTWTALIAPRWQGKIALADPRFGTTRSHFGAMKAYWDTYAMPGYFEAFAEGLAENHPKVLTSGNAGVIDAVVRGEVEIGLTDTDDVRAAQARGLNIAMVFPRHANDSLTKGGGTYLIPNTVAMVTGGPNPVEARRFLEFMLNPNTELQLAAMPERPVPLIAPANEHDLGVNDPLLIDPRMVAGASSEAVEAFLAAVKVVEETK